MLSNQFYAFIIQMWLFVLHPVGSFMCKQIKKKKSNMTPLCWVFKGVLHLLPQKAPKLAYFVLYLKIVNIFLKNSICFL